MPIIFYLLLSLSAGRCTDDLIFETKTVSVGDKVTLNCTRQKSEHPTTLYWTRLVSINLPEFLGGTFSFDYDGDDDGVNKTPRITAEQGPGAFLLHINEIKPSDTGVYYCIKVNQLYMTFLKGTLLIIKGRKPDITAIIQTSPSDPVHPGDSVTLQCSVLSDSEDKTCPGDHSVYWFRTGSDESHPSVIYTHGKTGDECEKSPEAHSPQTCVYSFSKNISVSDAGTYYCAVATCGHILFGSGTKVDFEAPNNGDLQKANVVLYLLCAALAISLIVTYLIYTIKKNSCGCFNAAVVLDTATAQQSQQRVKDSLAYSAPTFTKRRAGKPERRNVKTAEGETIYADVKV